MSNKCQSDIRIFLTNVYGWIKTFGGINIILAFYSILIKSLFIDFYNTALYVNCFCNLSRPRKEIGEGGEKRDEWASRICYYWFWKPL